MENDLLSDIEAFLIERGLSGHRFGMLAVKNGRLVERLRSGCRVWPDTASKVRTFIETERRAGRPTASPGRGRRKIDLQIGGAA